MSFGENIGYYRRHLNITQEELAERLFVSRQTISRWETDSVLPDVETIVKLCDVFDCDMDTLVRGEASSSEKPITEAREKKDDVIAEMKEELKRRSLISERIVGVVASTCALISAFAYLLCGFIWGLWHPMWLIFVGAIIVIAVTAVISDAVIGITDLRKKINHEKRKQKRRAVK